MDRVLPGLSAFSVYDNADVELAGDVASLQEELLQLVVVVVASIVGIVQPMQRIADDVCKYYSRVLIEIPLP